MRASLLPVLVILSLTFLGVVACYHIPTGNNALEEEAFTKRTSTGRDVRRRVQRGKEQQQEVMDRNPIIVGTNPNRQTNPSPHTFLGNAEYHKERIRTLGKQDDQILESLSRPLRLVKQEMVRHGSQTIKQAKSALTGVEAVQEGEGVIERPTNRMRASTSALKHAMDTTVSSAKFATGLVAAGGLSTVSTVAHSVPITAHGVAVGAHLTLHHLSGEPSRSKKKDKKS